jgi:hypothetical protein
MMYGLLDGPRRRAGPVNLAQRDDYACRVKILLTSEMVS